MSSHHLIWSLASRRHSAEPGWMNEHRSTAVQLPSRVLLFLTPWAAARQASLSLTISWSSSEFMSVESVMHSKCQPLWKTQQWPQDWKRSVCIPIPEEGSAEGCPVPLFENRATGAPLIVACLWVSRLTPLQASTCRSVEWGEALHLPSQCQTPGEQSWERLVWGLTLLPALNCFPSPSHLPMTLQGYLLVIS